MRIGQLHSVCRLWSHDPGGSKAVEYWWIEVGIKGDVSLNFVQFTEDSERSRLKKEHQARLSGRMILRQRLLCLIYR